MAGQGIRSVEDASGLIGIWKRLANRRLGKYALVGLINTIVGCGVMYLAFNVLNWSYGVSSIMNYVVGGALGYVLNKYFTFQSKEKSANEVVRYIINVAVCYVLSYGAGYWLISWVLGWGCFTQIVAMFGDKLTGNIAMGFSAVLYVAINYVGQSLLVFTKVSEVKPNKV